MTATVQAAMPHGERWKTALPLHDRRPSATLYVFALMAKTLTRWYEKQVKKRLKRRMERAMPLSAFLFNSLMPQVDLSTPDGRARLRYAGTAIDIASAGRNAANISSSGISNKLGHT